MLSPEDIKAEKHFLLGVLIIGLVLLGINYSTGFFTRLHLANEETMALQHGTDSALFKQMVAELIDDLHSKIVWKRQIAAIELGHLGAGAADAIPDLKSLLTDEHQAVRTAAALALGRIGSYSVDMLNPLLELLQGSNNPKRYMAVKGLGMIGPDARAAIPVLQQELQNSNRELADAVREALGRINADGN